MATTSRTGMLTTRVEDEVLTELNKLAQTRDELLPEDQRGRETTGRSALVRDVLLLALRDEDLRQRLVTRDLPGAAA